MNTRFIIPLAVAAGFAGGVASQCLGRAVHAQSPMALEIRAQKFILIDKTGAPRGVFGVESNGNPEVEIKNAKGEVLACGFQRWAVMHHGVLTPDFTASPGPKVPTLLPMNP